MFYHHALALQQNTDPEATEPPSLAGNRPHLFANFKTIWRFVAPDGLGIDTNKFARSALRDVMFQHRLASSSPSQIWCRQFLPSKFLRTILLSIVSVNRRFRWTFSFSSDLRRCVSETFILPYLALNFKNDAGLRPFLWHTSAVGIPAFCFLIIPIIKVSVKRLLRIRSLLREVEQTLHQSDRGFGGGGKVTPG